MRLPKAIWAVVTVVPLLALAGTVIFHWSKSDGACASKATIAQYRRARTLALQQMAPVAILGTTWANE